MHQPPPLHDPVLRLGHAPLTWQELFRRSRTPLRVDIDPEAARRVTVSWETVTRVAQQRPVYGRTTGVGANRTVHLDTSDSEKDLSLLRSHGTGSGRWLPSRMVRAGLLARLNQLLQGGSGMHPDIIPALEDTLASDELPRVHAFGAIGTGDLSSFGEVALGLMGESELSGGSLIRRWWPHEGDALPFLSTNAMTTAQAALLAGRLHAWLSCYEKVAALSFLAVGGSSETFAPQLDRARPHRGQLTVAERLRTLLQGEDHEPRRVQDSYGFRALPAVAGAFQQTLDRLGEVLDIELNAASENPFVSLEASDVFHNANFHTMELALALDQTKLALSGVGHLSLARLGDLSNPGMTGLQPFLAQGNPGDSGIMVLEYNAAAALSRLRAAAQPASLGSVVISRGTEDHASFSTQAVEQLTQCLDAAETVLACELVACVRALVLQGRAPAADSDLGSFFDSLQPLRAAQAPGDRSLSDDIAQATRHLHLLSADED
ncbi:histidine ammonia-lyase [Arthrobacter woluwensis]|uniref:aromatic amino acid ammonia-lyase n=1 Tax=Arthrobacter woluwensis TaxID=156980 RepID=UPI0027861F3A|nr:aromatic amino acid ammonia-lyase [Arthrobacter woluwensis]MDQ0709268.1 histidine ammonia-lyase [Arthrobacter woluwensis]